MFVVYQVSTHLSTKNSAKAKDKIKTRLSTAAKAVEWLAAGLKSGQFGGIIQQEG